METPSKSAFTLSKVKLMKDGGLDCHFEIEQKCGEEIYNEKYHTESAKDVHPDLRACFDKLKPVLARVYHMSFFRTLLDSPDFGASKLQQEFAETAFAEIMQKINVTGVALSGSDENVGFVISGTFTADSNQKMAINSHRMKFKDTRYGFEQECEEIIATLEEEAYAFLYEGKKAQLELFSGEEE